MKGCIMKVGTVKQTCMLGQNYVAIYTFTAAGDGSFCASDIRPLSEKLDTGWLEVYDGTDAFLDLFADKATEV